MVFSDLSFLLFFPIVVILFFGNQQFKKSAILIISYLFYSFWNWKFIFLLIFSTLINFFLGKKISETKYSNFKKFYLTLSLLQNLGFLVFFKYCNFFIEEFSKIISLIGLQPSIHTLNIILPLGISFYTFQTMSYCIDIYNKKANPAKSILDFANYVAFFPQLVAGPIERASKLLPQMENFNGFTGKYLKEGLLLILIGYIRKVLIADNCINFVNMCFTSPEKYSFIVLFTGAIVFSIQIYFDFSGYSDIARGIAKLFGIDLMVNFRQPFFSENIREFWKRWHISLSTWLRDYVYIPLGGNRTGNVYINTFITMTLCGLWHGAAWTYIIFGILHSFYIISYKICSNIVKIHIPKVINIVMNFIIISFIFIIFRAENLSNFMDYIINMTNLSNQMVLQCILILILAILAILILDFPAYKYEDETAIFTKIPKLLAISLEIICIILILTEIIVKFLISDSTPQFIYFQF